MQSFRYFYFWYYFFGNVGEDSLRFKNIDKQYKPRVKHGAFF